MQEKIAALITLEQGKTFEDAKGDVMRGLRQLFYFYSLMACSSKNIQLCSFYNMFCCHHSQFKIVFDTVINKLATDSTIVYAQ